MTLAIQAAHAQTAPSGPGNGAPEAIERVEVVGVRASLERSLRQKQRADQVVDVISAEDVGKLPDANVAEALQRVPGVQIERNFGEGAQIAVRGLTQVRVELNGRSNLGISVGPTGNDASGRSTGLEQLSSTMFSNLAVYKSPTADQIEGGLGGFVSMKTPSGFDFKKTSFGYTAESTRSSLADRREGFNLAAFFATQMIDGRLGIVAGLSESERTVGSRQFTRGLWNPGTSTGTRTDFNRDSFTDFVPQVVRAEFFDVDRKRTGSNLGIKFKASDSLTLYGDALYARLTTSRDTSYFSFQSTETGSAAPTLSNGVMDGNYVVAGRLSNQRLRVGGIQRNEPTTSLVAGAGAEYTSERFDLKLDLGRSEGKYDFSQDILEVASPGLVVDYDFRTGDVPRIGLPSNFDSTSRRSYTAVTNRGSSEQYVSTTEDALRLDGTLHFDDNTFSSLQFGARHAVLKSHQWALQARLGAPTFPAIDAIPDVYFGVDTRGFPGASGNFPPAFLRTFPHAEGSDETSWLLSFNRPLRDRPALFYAITETTNAGHLRLNWEHHVAGIAARGNVGLRVVETDFKVDSNTQVGTNFLPTTNANKYRDLLPSANAVFSLQKDLLLRLSASKVMARARLQDLAPFLFVDTVLLRATGGNAELKPTYATQGDVSLEYYLPHQGALTAAFFAKSIKDQISTVVQSDVIDGFESLGPVQRTLPINLGTARIQGLEMAYQQVFGFLPGPWAGLGMQVNATMVNSSSSDGLPVLGLSRRTANAVLFYERDDFSIRAAYNWRSRYAVGFTTAPTAAGTVVVPNLLRPNWHAPYEQIDLSASFKLNRWVTLGLQVANLQPSRSERKQYTELASATTRYELNDRYLRIGLRGHF